jgi:molecular chaperone HscA
MARGIGIDLGTTYSLTATVRDGKPCVLRDENGEGRVPSAVFFSSALDEGAIVGFPALAASAEGEGSLLTSTKRFMGKGRSAAVAFAVDGARTFELAEGDERVVRFAVPDGKGASRAVTPIEVAAYVLKSLADNAEAALGEPVRDVVITVPAYFDEAQRQATRDAGRLAGLRVLRLLTEPTAAAVAYGLDKEAEGRGSGTYVVFDLGGGTFDVSVLTFDRGLFRVRATAGDTALGGDDFDWPLAQRVLAAAEIDVATAPAATVHQALAFARRAKEALTDVEQVDARGMVGGHDVSLSLTRAELEALMAPVIARCTEPCAQAMRDAGLELKDLDGVILVGGSTRVPAVRRFVADFFQREPLVDANPDEVVAIGAALQADLLTGGERDMLLLDVTPLSLGLETMGGVVDKLIPRNQTIPCSATHTFTTYADNQTAMDMHVIQGEREKVEHGKSLARFKLRGIPPMGAGLARVTVTFTLDADGLLTVTAREESTGKAQSIEVKPSYGLTDNEVEQMLLDSIDYAEQDITERLLIEKRVEARRILEATDKALAEDAALIDAAERASIDAAVATTVNAVAGTDRHALTAAIEGLDHATVELARRRMERRIAAALENKSVDDVLTSTSEASR